MKKWICVVCGWVYDEAKGWPDDGIAPGTKWEDIPEDWTCPECGVGKEDFEMVEVKSSAVSTPEVAPVAAVNVDPVVVIGSGLAAYNLVKEYRKLDPVTPVIMISRDDGSLYYKPNLSCGLTNEKTPDEIVMSLAGEVASELSVTLKPYTEVTAIDGPAKKIVMGQEEQKYSKLILATGAAAICPPFSGDGVGHMRHVNDLLDYRKYRDELVGASKVVIIGAGLIGCEFANDLVNHGMSVEVIDTFDHCMPNLLPEAAARAVEHALNDKGARFHFGSRVQSVNKETNGYTVGLKDGTSLEADIVLCAVGLRANVKLAEQAGLSVDRGIVVNRYLETSQPDIYALGDCANVEGQLLMYVEPLILSAKALAQTVSGTRKAVDYRVMPVTVKTPACPVVVATPPVTCEGDWDIQADGNDVEALYRDEAGEVTGFVLTGKHVAFKKQLGASLPSLFKG